VPLFDKDGIIEPMEMEQQAKLLFNDWEQQFNEGGNIKNNLIMKFLKKICFNVKQNYACSAGLSYFGVGADGRVYPCHRLFNNPDYVIGDVWNGIDYDMTNLLFNHTIDQRETCSKCPVLFTCGSTCPVDSFINGGFDKVDPAYCEFNKTIIKECIRFLIKINRTNSNKYQELIMMLNSNNNTGKENKTTEFPFIEINNFPVLPKDFQNLIPQKSVNARVVDLDEDGIIYIEGDIDKKYIANITTMAIWDLIDGRRTSMEIAGIIADLCNVNSEEIYEDIYKQIAILKELGFVYV
jgi:radical SAM protein with 4Fe4S-binding SPASM domain